jgi:TolA-binding protein
MSADESKNEMMSQLLRQRNLFAVLAACFVASIGFAVPRKIASYRESNAVDNRIVELQEAIVRTQQHIRDIEAQITRDQQEIRKRQLK